MALENQINKKCPVIPAKDEVITMSKEEAIDILKTLEGLKRKIQPLVSGK